MPEALIALKSVEKVFHGRDGDVLAVDNIDLDIGEGEVVCLVGESGCGKTTTGKMLAGLLRPTRGSVIYRGADLRSLRGSAWKRYRLGVQLVHQDPYASLNPTQRVEDLLAAPLRRHGLVPRAALRQRLHELLESVDLLPPEDILAKFPHQLSGGQRQRVAIARALTVSPSFLIADEAVSMVDVSIRVSLLSTLRNLRESMGLAVLFITHDLALARYFARDGRIGVMYLGKIVELGSAREVIEHPKHPYSRALLAAAPGRDHDRNVAMRGDADVPTLSDRPAGCPFHPRCPIAESGLCEVIEPPLSRLSTGVHVACHPVARVMGVGMSRLTLPGATEVAPDSAQVAQRSRNGVPAAQTGLELEGSGVRTRATKGGPQGE